MEFRHGGARTACRDPQACDFWVEASGEFTKQTDKEFLAFLKASPHIPYYKIRLTSEGGDVQSALRLGLALRSRNFTSETNFCASACLYAFLGGVERKVIGEKPKLGIHRFYYGRAIFQPQLKQFSGEDMDDTQRLMAGLLLYASKMGVDLRLLALSIQAGPSQMRWLTPNELIEFKVTYQPNAWTPWRVVVPSNSKGLIAISETQDESRSMQIYCTKDQSYFTVVASNEDHNWFEQCRTILPLHPVLGVDIPAAAITVTKNPAGIVFSLPSQGYSFTSASIFSEKDADYPMACRSERYIGTSENLKRMATLALRNCVD